MTREGTGKTYLAAFDVKNAAPKRVLFVIHREQIARDAMQTFKKVLPHMSMGFLSGTKKDINADAIFTTIQSMSLDNNLHQFSKEHFDYIIYDEAHRTGASSYLKVMDYFKAKFTLGMSATPERTDDFNTFELFDYNIAYEIRLQGALEEEMLTPFHYFGISDVTIDNELIEDKSKISNLLSVHRVDRIVEAMDYYGHSGVRVKGLIFCSRTEEALALSEKLNEHGLRTIALTGSNSQDEREDAVRRLSKDDGDLDYILTVDIFNEGIDIPEVNQVVMLRPTESAIVFVQQLGRGLRKTKNKEFVIVIDFIGNYKNNFMIPIALSGDKSMSPNNLRKYIMSGNSFIPKASTIEFDAIAKERIYESIDKSSFTSFSYLKKAYFELKYKLGHIPKLTEFLEYGALDPQVIFSHARFSNYHKFLKVVDKSYSVELSEVEDQILSYISKEFSSGKRLIEINIINEVIKGDLELRNLEVLYPRYEIEAALRYLEQSFLTDPERRKYNKVVFIKQRSNIISIANTFKEALNNNDFKRAIYDLLKYSKIHHDLRYKDTDAHNLVIGEQYTRKDTSWLLNWENNRAGVINGYMLNHATKTIPLFVTYSKSESIDASINYNDYFINNETFHWQSKNNRSLESKEIITINNAKERGYSVLLFVKRSDGEEQQFYYLGELDPKAWEQSSIYSKGKDLPVVNVIYKIKTPVKEDLYSYLTEK